jgi:VWFA-related protein
VRTAIVVATFAGIGIAVSAQQPPVDTFRTSTRLVPISVVVYDRNGQPVEGLTAADFTITEDGVPHSVALFSAESRGAARAAAETLPANVFTNQIEGTAAGGVTILLFDRLNTADQDQQRAREHIIRFLRQLDPNDRVGFYLLDGTSVRVLHDFSRDASSLLRALDRAVAPTSAALAGSEDSLGRFEPIDHPVDRELADFLSQAEASIQGFHKDVRAAHTSSALEAVALHLAGVRGRKSVIWISSGFPLFFSDGIMRTGERSMSAAIARATRALSHSDVAIYPVDARGVPGVFATPAAAQAQQFSTLAQRVAPIETAQTIAEQTGGRAFHSTNDLGHAMARAAADADLTYILGYYPVNEKWDGRFRNIRVTVNRPGVDVRHRRGYFAHPPAADAKQSETAVLEALHSPLDATGLALTVAAEPGDAPGRYRLAIGLHPGAVTLRQTDAGWEGAVRLAIGQALPDGRLLRSADLAVPVRVAAHERDSLLTEGLTLNAMLDLRADAHQVKIVARDAQSGALGSLAIPADRLRTPN